MSNERGGAVVTDKSRSWNYFLVDFLLLLFVNTRMTELEPLQRVCFRPNLKQFSLLF